MLFPRLTHGCHILTDITAFPHERTAASDHGKTTKATVCFWASKSPSSTSQPQILLQKQSLQICRSWSCEIAQLKISFYFFFPLRRFCGYNFMQLFYAFTSGRCSCGARNVSTSFPLPYLRLPPQSRLSLSKDNATFSETLLSFFFFHLGCLPASSHRWIWPSERNSGTNMIALTFVTFAEAGTHGLRMAKQLSVHHGGEKRRRKKDLEGGGWWCRCSRGAEDRRWEGKSRERMPADASVDLSV